MKVYDYLNENAAAIRELIRAGIIRCNFEQEMAVYHFFKCQYKETGSKMQAATNCGEVYHISERKVFRIVKKYSQTFDTPQTNNLL